MEADLDSSATSFEPSQPRQGYNEDTGYSRSEGGSPISPRQRTDSTSSKDSNNPTSNQAHNAEMDPMRSSIHSIYRLFKSGDGLTDLSQSYIADQTSETCRVSAGAEPYDAPTKEPGEIHLEKCNIAPPTSSSLTASSLRALDRANSRQQQNPPASLRAYKSEASSRSSKDCTQSEVDKGKRKEEAILIPSDKDELAARLQDVFGLEKREEVLAGT